MGLYKAQFISMIIMIALGIGIFVGFNMEWVSIDVNTSSFFEKTNFADFRIISDSGFSEDDLNKVKDIDGVSDVSRFLSVNADVEGQNGDTVALTVTENENVSKPYLISGKEYDAKSENGVWLSYKYAAANGFELGDDITFKYKTIEISGKVEGLIKASEYLVCVRDSSQLMPDYNTHGFAYISPVMYEKAAKMAFYPQINILSSLSKKEMAEKIDAALDKTLLVLSKDENSSYAAQQGEAEEGKTMGSVMPVLFLLIAVLTMVTTMHRLTAKEKTQIGTLKALGFKDKRILRHYTSYAFMIGIIGSALGIGLGYFVAWFLMNPNGSMGTYLDMPEWKLGIPWFCYIILAAIIVLLTLIGFLSVKQMLHGTPADALRPYTPKKVKNLLVEKTKWFHRLSFGTRWNLRDTMRHKSRTAMSLIGIIGCTLLIVGSLGMRDTMTAFLDMYYNDATNYSSKIYVSEDATDEQIQELIKKYDGDWSASVSVQLNEKAISLDVYELTTNKVRFPSAETKVFENIGDDGAYICKRLSDEFNLKKGDTVTISPYGSDDEYTLKISGIIRSVSENIVISPKYAEKAGIAVKADSIYTSTEKADIKAESAIKSVQSKQMIIDSFDTFNEIMNMMVAVLIVAATVLGIVVLYNLGVMSYTERYREMATLKVVGFRNRKIGKLLISQNMWVTVIGVIVGIPAGIGTLSFLVTQLASEYEMRISVSVLSIAVSAVLTFAVSLLVSLMVARKNKKIDMVEALKGAE